MSRSLWIVAACVACAVVFPAWNASALVSLEFIGRPGVELADALPLMNEVVQSHPDDANARFARIVLQFSLADAVADEPDGDAPREAALAAIEADLATLEELGADLSRIHFYRGHVALERSADFEAALADFAQVTPSLAEDRDFVQLYVALLASAEKTPAAIEVLETSSTARSDPVLQQMLGALYLVEDRYDEAIVVVEPVVAKHPGYDEARMVLAGAHALKGELALARAEFEEIVKRDAGFKNAHLALIGLNREMGDRTAFDRVVARATAAFPDDPEIAEQIESQRAKFEPGDGGIERP